MAIYRDPQDLVIKEYFDIKDNDTRKFLTSLNEDDKSTILTALASALYDKIVEKVDDIDFGTIPKSNGDITKVDGFANTIECLNIIKKLVLEYKQNPNCVDTVISAIENIKQRKAIFMKAFALKVELPVMLYNLTVLAIEHSVSFLIGVCIDYVKTPGNGRIELSLSNVAYNNAEDNLLFAQLKEFNAACGSGQFDATVSELINKKPYIKEDADIVNPMMPADDTQPDYPNQQLFGGQIDDNEPVQIQPIIPEEDDPSIESEDEDNLNNEPSFDEPVATNEIGGLAMAAFAAAPLPVKIGMAVTGAALAAKGVGYALKGGVYLVKSIIPTMRNIAYFFTSFKEKLSASLLVQSQLIELNAYNLQYDDQSNLDSDKRSKIVSKQLKIADKLKKWGNKFAIDSKKAEKKAKEDMNNDNKKYTKDEIRDNVPADADILF